MVPRWQLEQPEHGARHGDRAHGDVAEGEVDDEEVARHAGLRVAHNHPADADVGD